MQRVGVFAAAVTAAAATFAVALVMKEQKIGLFQGYVDKKRGEQECEGNRVSWKDEAIGETLAQERCFSKVEPPSVGMNSTLCTL